MKHFKIFIIGLVAILIIQFGVLVFLETVYFADNASYSSTKVETDETKETPMVKLTLEEGSTNVSASYDGKYISYLKDNDLYVLNSEDNGKFKVSSDEGMEITYSKWIYDRNRLILAERPLSSRSSNYIKLFYYDVDSKSKAEIYNEVNNKSVLIPINNSNEKISSIDMSTLTNVIYIKMSSSSSSSIYSINIMAQEKSVSTVTHNIGKIISTKRDDVLLYEDLSNKKVYHNGSDLPIAAEGKSNLSLLGIDNKDNVYLALTDNGKAKEIYYGNITNKNWKTMNITVPVDISSIHVNFNGLIFIQDDSKSMLKELLSGNEFNYSGKIVARYDEGIVLEKGGKISKMITK